MRRACRQAGRQAGNDRQVGIYHLNKIGKEKINDDTKVT